MENDGYLLQHTLFPLSLEINKKERFHYQHIICHRRPARHSTYEHVLTNYRELSAALSATLSTGGLLLSLHDPLHELRCVRKLRDLCRSDF